MSHNNIGSVQSRTGHPAEALESYRRALAIRQKLADDNPAVTDFPSRLADGLLNIGYLRLTSGRLTEAAGDFAREAAIREKLAGDNPSIPILRSDLANCLNNAAALLLRLGRASEARVRSERAVSLLETLSREDPETTRYRWMLAEGYLRFGHAREAAGDHAGAGNAWRRADALLQAIPNLDGENTFFHGCCHAKLAGLASHDGAGISADEASSHAETAMALLTKAVGMGYRDADAFRNESALDPLRGRPDFQILMMDLAFPAESFVVGR